MTVADVGPDSWAWRAKGGAPGLPFYADPLDPLQLARGREPLLKVPGRGGRQAGERLWGAPQTRRPPALTGPTHRSLAPQQVRLTALHGGPGISRQILALSLCHAVCDGMRWPQLLRHLAARYREAAGGAAPDLSDLLRPGPRTLLSVAALKR